MSRIHININEVFNDQDCVKIDCTIRYNRFYGVAMIKCNRCKKYIQSPRKHDWIDLATNDADLIFRIITRHKCENESEIEKKEEKGGDMNNVA